MCTCICLYDCMNSIICIVAAAMKFAPRRVARTEGANERWEGEGGRRQFRFAPHCISALPAPLCIVILISGKSGDGFEVDVVRELVL